MGCSTPWSTPALPTADRSDVSNRAARTEKTGFRPWIENASSSASVHDLSFLLREPAHVYHEKARDYLSSHRLADFRKCPLLYWKKSEGLIVDEDRPAYLVGRAAHTLILEGERKFEAKYAVGGSINPSTGQPCGPRTKAYACNGPQKLDRLMGSPSHRSHHLFADIRPRWNVPFTGRNIVNLIRPAHTADVGFGLNDALLAWLRAATDKPTPIRLSLFQTRSILVFTIEVRFRRASSWSKPPPTN